MLDCCHTLIQSTATFSIAMQSDCKVFLCYTAIHVRKHIINLSVGGNEEEETEQH